MSSGSPTIEKLQCQFLVVFVYTHSTDSQDMLQTHVIKRRLADHQPHRLLAASHQLYDMVPRGGAHVLFIDSEQLIAWLQLANARSILRHKPRNTNNYLMLYRTLLSFFSLSTLRHMTVSGGFRIIYLGGPGSDLPWGLEHPTVQRGFWGSFPRENMFINCAS